MYLTEDEIKNGFWNHHRKKSFPPKAITYPDEYLGDNNLNIVCTQLSVGSYQQRKLVNTWCQLIPKLKNVRYLWFSSKVNQALFDAACENQEIEGLYIKWSGIKDLSSLSNLGKIKYLHIGSSASVESINIFADMDQLLVLEIENFIRYLFLTNLRTLNETLAALAQIKTLMHIRTSYWWPKSEFKLLREHLPELKYGSPFETELIEQFGM
jgi:hypothetical protein